MFYKKAFTLPTQNQSKNNVRRASQEPAPRRTQPRTSECVPRGSNYGKLDDTNSLDNEGFTFKEYLPGHRTPTTKTMFARRLPQTIGNDSMKFNGLGGNFNGLMGKSNGMGGNHVTTPSKPPSDNDQKSKRPRIENHFDDVLNSNNARNNVTTDRRASNDDYTIFQQAKPYTSTENIELDYMIDVNHKDRHISRSSSSNHKQREQTRNSQSPNYASYHRHLEDRNERLPKRWYSNDATSPCTHHDMVSLHSILSKKSVKETVKTPWVNKLQYAIIGILLWTFIVLCIEEIDNTSGQHVCLKFQEIRYWASYVCLVVIVTAAGTYVEKGSVFDSIILAIFNTIALISIHHVPLDCIKLDNFGANEMARIRGGLVLFLILTIFITWLLKICIRGKRPWNSS